MRVRGGREREREREREKVGNGESPFSVGVKETGKHTGLKHMAV